MSLCNTLIRTTLYPVTAMTLACFKRSFGGGASQNEDKCQKKTKQNKTKQNRIRNRNETPIPVLFSAPYPALSCLIILTESC